MLVGLVHQVAPALLVPPVSPASLDNVDHLAPREIAARKDPMESPVNAVFLVFKVKTCSKCLLRNVYITS